MSGRHKDVGGEATGGGARHRTPAQAASGLPADVFATDPELESDLEAQPRVEDQLEAARLEAADARERALRAQADFENTRRRLEARHADEVLRASERVVRELLPVIDDLERAIEHAPTPEGAGGLDAVRRKLLDVLAREGCTEIDPLGGPFDPERHSAAQMREDAEVPHHTVVEVFQRGYEMHGRVLRPAMVVVSEGGPAS